MSKSSRWFSLAIAAALAPAVVAAPAVAKTSFLDALKKTTTLGSTVPDNGDVNPYALLVAPVSIGKIKKGDVLVDNFNDKHNLQGVGTTIVNYSPATKTTTLLPRCRRICRHAPAASDSRPRCPCSNRAM